MKYFFIIWALIAIGFSTNAQSGGVFKTAVEYNDYIVSEQLKVGEIIKVFVKEMEVGTQSSIGTKREAIATAAKLAASTVQKMPAFNNNTQLRDAATKLFLFYEQAALIEYKELIELIFNKEITEENLNKRMSELVAQITEKEAKFDHDFQEAQKAFAKANNMTLSENTFDLDK